MNHFSVLITLLRDRKTFLEDVRNSVKLETKIASLLISSSFFFAVYGAIIGAYGGGLQIISSAIKLPALYLLTLIICIPRGGGAVISLIFSLVPSSILSSMSPRRLPAVSVISVLSI